MQQLKLFNQVSSYEDIKNMGMVISCECFSRGIYGADYYIKIKNDILSHITMHELSDMIFKKFMGCYGGKMNIKQCTDYIVAHVDAWND